MQQGRKDQAETIPSLEAQVEKAFALVARPEKQEFDEAREIIPELVARETKFIDFLRTENMDPLKAAKRIAAYWKARKILFSERWLLPMNQTGAGALDMSDIEILRMGSRVIFSRPGQGFFAIVDESRLTRPPGNSIFKMMLYMGSIFCDEYTQKEGTTVVHIVNSKPRPAPNLDRHLFDMINAGIPAKLKAYHVVQAHEGNKKELLDFLGYKESKVAGFRVRTNPNLIAADSMSGTLKILQDLGFKREHLPRCVGGSYDYSQFAEWTRMRISLEDAMSSSPLMANRLAIVPSTRVDAPNRRKKLLLGKETETNEEKRQRNALKSRRSYHRRQLELFSLQEQERVWHMRNEPIRKQNEFLESLLAQALTCVMAHTEEGSMH